MVGDVPDAQMRETTDVLLRLNSTAICGTDLHVYDRPMRGLKGRVIGHEPLGVVEEVGSAVKSVKKGDCSLLFQLTSAAVSAPIVRRAIHRLVSRLIPDRRGRPMATQTRAAIREFRPSFSVCLLAMPTV